MVILESVMLLHWYLRYSCLYKQSNTEWQLELSVTVSQDVSAHLATRAHMVVLNQPSVALALFSHCLDSPHVTGAQQVIKIPLDLYSSNCTQINKVLLCYYKTDTPLCSGFYCVEGSSLPSPCPLGSLGLLTGRMSLAHCSPCPPGFFCNGSALTEPTGPCSPGLTVQFHSVKSY